jgi:hypothetical protein
MTMCKRRTWDEIVALTERVWGPVQKGQVMPDGQTALMSRYNGRVVAWATPVARSFPDDIAFWEVEL